MVDKGYGDKRIFTCVCCGAEVELTKFASAKTAKCQKCKESGAPIDQTIVERVMAKIKPKKEPTGETKQCACIKCGKMVTVTKFASAAKVICNECKGIDAPDEATKKQVQCVTSVKVNLSKSKMPPITEYNVLPTLIANRRLREVKCPACGHEYMKIIRILDWSTFGLVVTYQCEECLCGITLSEQAQSMSKPLSPSTSVDYSMDEINCRISALESGRLKNSLRTMVDLCKEHGIELPKVELPYTHVEDKPVPVGFILDKNDRNIKIVDDAIKSLTESGNTEIANKLKLLWEDKNESDTSGVCEG